MAEETGQAGGKSGDRDYVRGEDATGRGAGFHLTKRRLKAPKRG